MKRNIKGLFSSLYAILLLVCMLCVPVGASGLSLTTYTPSSRLAQGRWVKVSVPESGIYFITNDMLRRWGFTNPERVRVFGYGAHNVPDRISMAGYIDDLPYAPQERTDKGLAFYGIGPERWNKVDGQYFSGSLSPYTTAGYYFLGEDDGEAPRLDIVGSQGLGSAPDDRVARSFIERVHYEQDLYSPGETGSMLVGEDLRYTPSRTFTFDLPGRVADTDVWFESSVVTKTFNAGSQLSFTANGTSLPEVSTDRIAATNNSVYYHGTEGITRHKFSLSGDKLNLGVKLSSSVTVQGAWLNYITVNYERRNALAGGRLLMRASVPAVSLEGASGSTHVWDVSNPLDVKAMNIRVDGSTATWTNVYSGDRTYIAWDDSHSLPAPTFVGNVTNQDVHGITDTPDMIIIAWPEWVSQAQRIAEMHALHDGLSTVVLTPAQIYNEFGSGSVSVHAVRNALKMFYDRGEAAGRPLRYALLMGRSTYDHRGLSSQSKALGINILPCYIGGSSRASLCDNDSYGTDDFIAMLADGAGGALGSDKLEIAVGRMPVRSLSEATAAVDKLEEYMFKSKRSGWKNQTLILADDGDMGIHMIQSDTLANNLQATLNQPYVVNKIYLDAYSKSGSDYTAARNKMFRLLDEGLAWWVFIGHANATSWTGDGQLTYSDLNNLYMRRLPVLYAATCDFLRWDAQATSGGELMFHNRNGGIIAAISATRPVYISDNGYFSSAMGRHIAARDEQGNLFPAGEVYRRAKNDIRNSRGTLMSNTNKLRYVFMGDPAMRVVTPSPVVRLETIDGIEVNDDNQVTLAALQHALLEGGVYTIDGELMTDFDGVVDITLYDAEKTTESLGNGEDGIKYPFDEHGERLYAGSGNVSAGRFKVNVAMPGDVADNFRPALLSMYARSTVNNDEAIGINNAFYVYGTDEAAPLDTISPRIDAFYLNHANFTDGTMVDLAPVVIANVSDNVGINLSNAGIGRQMTLTLDGRTTYTDVASYYNPSADGSPAGQIYYPLSEIAEGPHELTLRVWDTSGNSASHTIAFHAANGVAPEIVDVYSDANPAHDSAGFYVVCDRPDALSTVTVTVYDLMGRVVWGSKASGRNDMGVSSPLVWNLTDYAGRRVNRGIYIYRATITTDGGETFASASRKIAVAAK